MDQNTELADENTRGATAGDSRPSMTDALSTSAAQSRFLFGFHGLFFLFRSGGRPAGHSGNVPTAFTPHTPEQIAAIVAEIGTGVESFPERPEMLELDDLDVGSQPL